jgi:hypothetical protein
VATPLRHVRQVVAEPTSTQPEADWATQTADQIEKVVVGIRSKTTDPIDRVVRIVVYGIVAAVLGVTAMVLLSISLVRALDVLLPGEVWAAHVLLGGIFTLVGLFLWAKRRQPASDDA